jgi:hypothetical protein
MIDIVNSLQHYQPVLWNVDNSGLLESKRSVIQHDNEANKIAQQSATELMGAINKLDIHEDYRHVKHELYNELDGVINSTLQNYNGSLRYAINDLMSFSRDILASHKITGLVETNQQYKTWKAGIEARNDISDDIKEMVIAKNPYNFELTYKKNAKGEEIVDAAGNKEAIGYKDWVPTTHPVKQMSLNDIALIGLRYLNPSSSGTYGITYYDAEDNVIQGESFNASKVAAYKTSTTDTVILTQAEVLKALYAAYDAEPNMKASIMQDYEVEMWKYNQLLESGDTDAIKSFQKLSPFIDENNNPVNPEQYKENVLKSISETYSFTNSTTRGGFAGASGGGGGGNKAKNITVRDVTYTLGNGIYYDSSGNQLDLNGLTYDEIMNVYDQMAGR